MQQYLSGFTDITPQSRVLATLATTPNNVLIISLPEIRSITLEHVIAYCEFLLTGPNCLFYHC